jgi:hypothetical protein
MTEFLQVSHRSPDVDSVIESVKPFTQALQVQLPLGVQPQLRFKWFSVQCFLR